MEYQLTHQEFYQNFKLLEDYLLFLSLWQEVLSVENQV